MKIYSLLSRLALCGIVALALFTSCKSLKETKEETYQQLPENAIGDTFAQIDTTQTASLAAWRTFFTDPYLQEIIDSALAKNITLEQCRLRVKEMEYSLTAAKLAFLPALNFAPNASITDYNGATNRIFSLPVNLQWQIDVFGKIRHKKNQVKALTEQSRDVQQATQCELISNIASVYYQLLMLDREEEILKNTITVWEKSVYTQQAYYEAGTAYSDAVRRMEASYYSVHNQLIDVQRGIKTCENTLCYLLAETPHAIERGNISEIKLDQNLINNVPLAALRNRPDVRATERSLEAAYYVKRQAISAFYPDISLSGIVGWTNGGSGIEINPAKWLLNAAASLVQPIFAQGQLTANLKISKAQLQEAQLSFVDVILKAGNEVNNALVNCQSAQKKSIWCAKQVDALTHAYEDSRDRQDLNQGYYLEVLTAQESLLSAQLGQVSNEYDAINNLISLYVALGGGQ